MKMNMKWLGWFASVLVLAAVVAGFVTIGGPSKQRDTKFDQQRVSDLTNIQYEIRNYWVNNNKLPAKLTDIESNVSGFLLPKDPETGAAYEYILKSSLDFELCATFKLDSKSDSDGIRAMPMYYPYNNENWDHSAGRVCFTRNINPEVDKLQPLPLK